MKIAYFCSLHVCSSHITNILEETTNKVEKKLEVDKICEQP